MFLSIKNVVVFLKLFVLIFFVLSLIGNRISCCPIHNKAI